jgi:hypothetical protein
VRVGKRKLLVCTESPDSTQNQIVGISGIAGARRAARGCTNTRLFGLEWSSDIIKWSGRETCVKKYARNIELAAGHGDEREEGAYVTLDGKEAIKREHGNVTRTKLAALGHAHSLTSTYIIHVLCEPFDRLAL